MSGGKLYVYAWKLVDPQDRMPLDDCTGGHIVNTEAVFAVYDPAKASPPRWRILPPETDGRGSLVSRCWHTLTSIENLVYVAGGNYECHNEDAVFEMRAFDTVTGQWLPDGQLRQPADPEFWLWRWGQSSLALNNRLYLFGGFNGDWYDQRHSQVRVYEPAINAWDDLPDLPFDLMFGGAAVHFDQDHRRRWRGSPCYPASGAGWLRCARA